MQLFEKTSSTYTYLIADKKTREAILIDPVQETLQRDLNLLKEYNLELKYVLETHVHADHITSAKELKNQTGAQLVYSKSSNLECADVLLDENQTIEVGSIKIKGILTPGHTNGCITYNINNMLFTGDTLLINSCGRTDFQQGSPEKLYESITKLYQYEDNTIVYPAHNYQGIPYTTIGNQKQNNAFYKKDTKKEEFVEYMNSRELPLPKQIDVSVPKNQLCGDCE